MRKSIDGLTALVQQNFQLNPFQNSLFLFCGRRHDRLKALSWDSNGFALYYKRLDGSGARFKWPKDPTDVRNIAVKQLRLLMEGMYLDPPKGFGEVSAKDFC